ncbi:MAG TPA: ribosome maturation factor RimM [Candidatus Limnocylindrales bacterium]|nr:ribosome maturation factor RimM [Candidatus Limnocylindrales bacterium]
MGEPRDPREPGDASAAVRLVVAQVRGLHGLNGAVRVEVLTDRPEDRFAPGSVLRVEGDPRPLTVESAGAVEDGPGWRLRFREIPSRNAAERLRDAYLEILVDRAADLDAGAAYWHEVVGSVVRDSKGAELGRVADVYRAGENEVYVVRGGPPGEFDLPAVRDVITSFAPERGEIIVDEAVLDLGGAVVDAPEKTSTKPRRRPRWSRHGKGAKPVDGAAGASDASGSPGSGDDGGPS